MTPKNVTRTTTTNAYHPQIHPDPRPGVDTSTARTGPLEKPDLSGASTRAQRRALTAERVTELVSATGQRRDDLVTELVLINRPVAWSVAARFDGRGVERDDLRQVAVLGLYKSVLRFDPQARSDLLSFAVPTMTGEIRRWFRDQGWMVRPPRRLQELQLRTGPVVERLGQSLGRTPTPREVADELGVCEGEHLEAQAAHGAFRPVSLDLPVGDGGSALGELVADGADPYAASRARVLLAPAIKNLGTVEAQMIEFRFGGELTQGEIGRRMGMSQAQVSRILTKVLRRMREEIEGEPAHGPQFTPVVLREASPRTTSEGGAVAC